MPKSPTTSPAFRQIVTAAPALGRSTVVLRRYAAELLPRLVGDGQHFFGQWTLFEHIEILFELAFVRCTDDHAVRRGMMQQPVECDIRKRTSGTIGGSA